MSKGYFNMSTLITVHTNLCVSGYPVGCLTVIVTFLDPASQPHTLDRVMPVLTTCKTEPITAGLTTNTMENCFCTKTNVKDRV